MKANHNGCNVAENDCFVVSKIVEKKNESKSQLNKETGEWLGLLCQRSLRKRMKANHNSLRCAHVKTFVVSKIVEKKNESKSQHCAWGLGIDLGCVKDR